MAFLVSLLIRMSGSLRLGVGGTTGETESQSESPAAGWGPNDHVTIKVSLYR